MTRTFIKDKLNVQVNKNRQELGIAAAVAAVERIRLLLKEKQTVNIIFAAAPSQNEFLHQLRADGSVEWNRINAFHMDEYLGLAADAPQTFGHFLKSAIFDQVPFRSVNYLDGAAADVSKECTRYAQLLQEHPPDVVFMGIGENTHLAFNDPPVADFNDPFLVKLVALDYDCRQQQVNDGCFPELREVPQFALTLTIPALMQAAYIFCMVPGKTKAVAVAKTLSGPVTGAHPSSILRTHNHAVLFTDAESFRLSENLSL